jgi:hypothetical protein
MAITVSISPTGLILESEARKNPNFVWDDYLEISPMILSNQDQILPHSDLFYLWEGWLGSNFDPDIAIVIDQAVNEVIYQTAESLESGVVGILPVSQEIEQLISEKLSLLANNDFMSLSIAA